MKTAVFIDCGDTLIDESTQDILRTDQGQGPLVGSADLIPGADTLLKTLKDRGIPLALVADGMAVSFKNILTGHGLWDLFDAHVISEEVGVMKPEAAMFTTAAEALKIPEEEYSLVLMVGNNLSRDIKGANRMGMKSVFLDWSPRYPSEPADAEETPDFTIRTPLELLEVIEKIEQEY